MRTRGVIVVALIAFAMACGTDVVDVDWTYEFANDATRTATAGLAAEVRRGPCGSGSAIVYGAAWTFGGRPTAAPSRLDEGEYSFDIYALDSGCTIIAHACDTVSLPDGRHLHQTLADETAGARRCDAGDCRGGTCEIPDAGLPPDAGPPRDAGTADDGGGMDGGVSDGGPADAPTCPPFMLDCNGDGTCESVASDRQCGSCTADCTTAVDEAASCQMLMDALDRPYFDCVLDSCTTDRFDCDGDWSNGCEVLCSCGAGTTCPTNPCGAGGCIATCDTPPCTLTCSGGCSMRSTNPQTGAIYCDDGADMCNGGCPSPGECVQTCVGIDFGTRCECRGSGC